MLYEAHRAQGAKLVEFSGWEMPIQYKGIIHEHQVVRTKVGLFDVSHMGRIIVEGRQAEALLDYLSTNDIAGKQDGTCTYTVWCDALGMCVDDLIIYRQTATKFFIIVNAGNRQKDLHHLQHYASGWDVKIIDRYQDDGILALQGPRAMDVMATLFSEVHTIKPMHFIAADYQGQEIIISRTGYTGAGGFEIYAPNTAMVELWNLLLKAGAGYGIEPIGLGARDTLRLEMGYALYGHEISDHIAPTESVSAWTVKWHKPDFLGKAALEVLQQSPTKRSEYGIVLTDKGIAREGYEVFKDGQLIGKVTSGTFSPSLNQAIAIVLVDINLQAGHNIDVQIRQQLCRGHVIKQPFYTGQ